MPLSNSLYIQGYLNNRANVHLILWRRIRCIWLSTELASLWKGLPNKPRSSTIARSCSSSRGSASYRRSSKTNAKAWEPSRSECSRLYSSNRPSRDRLSHKRKFKENDQLGSNSYHRYEVLFTLNQHGSYELLSHLEGSKTGTTHTLDFLLSLFHPLAEAFYLSEEDYQKCHILLYTLLKGHLVGKGQAQFFEVGCLSVDHLEKPVYLSTEDSILY